MPRINGNRFINLNYNKEQNVVQWVTQHFIFLNTQTNEKTYCEHLLHVFAAGSVSVVDVYSFVYILVFVLATLNA